MPLRFPVQDIYDMDCAKMIVGRLESGLLKKGQQVVVLPQNKKTKISSINVFGSCGQKAAYKGQNVGLILDNSLSVKRGDVIVEQNCASLPGSSFKGNVFWMSDQPFLLNKKMIFRCATQEAGCIGQSIEKKINSATLEIIDKDPQELRFNEAGSVVFKTDVPVVVEDFTFIEALGRFTLENGQEVQGAGIITKILP
jgi:bifunctional enzyme CysN/CysC